MERAISRYEPASDREGIRRHLGPHNAREPLSAAGAAVYIHGLIAAVPEACLATYGYGGVRIPCDPRRGCCRQAHEDRGRLALLVADSR
jgi:hypothetical protein